MDKHLIICAIRHSSFDDGVGLWDGGGIFRLGLLLFVLFGMVMVMLALVFLADSWLCVGLYDLVVQGCDAGRFWLLILMICC